MKDLTGVSIAVGSVDRRTRSPTAAQSALQSQTTINRELSLDDRQFLLQFLALQFPPSEFTHTEHLRLAWAILHQRSLADALTQTSNAISRFAKHHGDPGKFHATVTGAYVVAIHERIAQAPSNHACFKTFCTQNQDLLEPVTRFMNRRYQTTTWTADLARVKHLPPDRP